MSIANYFKVEFTKNNKKIRVQNKNKISYYSFNGTTVGTTTIPIKKIYFTSQMTISPDGNLIVTKERAGTTMRPLNFGYLKLWSKTGELLKKKRYIIRGHGDIHKLSFSPNSKYIISESMYINPCPYCTDVKIWSLSLKLISTIHQKSKITGFDISPDSEIFATSIMNDFSIKTWSVLSGPSKVPPLLHTIMLLSAPIVNIWYLEQVTILYSGLLKIIEFVF